jgi:L-alanine-DL-glutamate epimerase-like enolase superfamily enzyme
MVDKPRITKVEIFEFEYTTTGWGSDPKVPSAIYEPGNVREVRSKGLRVHTDEGVTGTYIGGYDTEYAGIPGFIDNVIGKNAFEREDIHYDGKHALRQHARMGLGIVDCALWDLAGRYFDVPVYDLLGGTKRRLAAYASTALGETTRTGSARLRRMPTLPRSATSSVFAPIKSTVGRTHRSRNISPWCTPWAAGSVTRCR